MNKLRISMTVREYERTSPLVSGKVSIEGVDPIFIPFEIDNFRRMLRYLEYDVAEMSMSSYLIARERGIPIIAIPVFPHRRFRHSYIFVNSSSGIKEPSDLIGKRVGVPEYQITALVWLRGILQHEYDVKPNKLKWFYDREDRIEIKLPDDVYIEKIVGKTKEELFLQDKIDVIIDGKIPEIYFSRRDKVKRLFENYRQVELDYYKRTGIFPIMHTIVIRENLYREHRWLAIAIWKAFVKAKEYSYKFTNDPRFSNLIWPHSYLEEERKLFGDDPWKYNIDDNRKVLETLAQYSYEQGLIAKIPEIDDLFAPNTLDLKEGKHIPYDV